MTSDAICRDALREVLDGPSEQLVRANAGLLMRRGMAHYEHDSLSEESGKSRGGRTKDRLLRTIAGISASAYYQLAYDRWCRVTDNPERFAHFDAEVDGRLYIGVTRDSALETGLSVQHSYGMPMIPGSSVKGLARSCASRWLAESQGAIVHLFGTDSSDDESVEDEAGGVVFHDAWWDPASNTKPFVPEIVMPHHTEYQRTEGEQGATDFDSPIPAPQLAVQGSFRFVIEGAPGWTSLATTLLKNALELQGVGAKRSSGYGFFKATSA